MPTTSDSPLYECDDANNQVVITYRGNRHWPRGRRCHPPVDRGSKFAKALAVPQVSNFIFLDFDDIPSPITAIESISVQTDPRVYITKSLCVSDCAEEVLLRTQPQGSAVPLNPDNVRHGLLCRTTDFSRRPPCPLCGAPPIHSTACHARNAMKPTQSTPPHHSTYATLFVFSISTSSALMDMLHLFL